MPSRDPPPIPPAFAFLYRSLDFPVLCVNQVLVFVHRLGQLSCSDLLSSFHAPGVGIHEVCIPSFPVEAVPTAVSAGP